METNQSKTSIFSKFTSLFKKENSQEKSTVVASSKEREQSFKCIMLGDSAVGKSSLIDNCILRNRPGTDRTNASGFPTYTELSYKLKEKVVLKMWEITGIMKAETISLYSARINLQIFMFDFGTYFTSSFPKVEEYLKMMKTECETILIGNKKDLLEDENCSKTASEFALKKMKGTLYVEMDTIDIQMAHSVILYSALILFFTNNKL